MTIDLQISFRFPFMIVLVIARKKFADEGAKDTD